MAVFFGYLPILNKSLGLNLVLTFKGYHSVKKKKKNSSHKLNSVHHYDPHYTEWNLIISIVSQFNPSVFAGDDFLNGKWLDQADQAFYLRLMEKKVKRCLTRNAVSI